MKEHEKQQLINLIQEIESVNGMLIDVHFDWTLSDRICTLTPLKNSFKIVINSAWFENSVRKRKQRFIITEYILEHIKLTRSVKTRMPEYYLEGMAFLQRIAETEESKTILVYLPSVFKVGYDDGNSDKRYIPSEIYCLYKACNTMAQRKIPLPKTIKKTESLLQIGENLIVASYDKKSHYNAMAYYLKRIKNLQCCNHEILSKYELFRIFSGEEWANATPKNLFNKGIMLNNTFVCRLSVQMLLYNKKRISDNMEKTIDSNILIPWIAEINDYLNIYAKSDSKGFERNTIALEHLLKCLNKTINTLPDGTNHPIYI